MRMIVDRIIKFLFILIVLFVLTACNAAVSAHSPNLFPTLATPVQISSPRVATTTFGPGSTPTAQVSATPIVGSSELGLPDTGSRLASTSTATTIACVYKATFMEAVTIPDGSVIAPGETFTKTWRIRNDGTCTWGPTGKNLYALVFLGGNRLGGPDQVVLPEDVLPGDTITISVNLTAPITPGSYTSEWKFLLRDGSTIGVGPSSSIPLTAVIHVLGALTRVDFNAGATSAVVRGTLSPGQSADYIVNALQGQELMARLSADQPGDVTLLDSKGNPLPSLIISDYGTFARSLLSTTQDYIVEVTARSQDIHYSLSITIPTRINFNPGATSATADGLVFQHDSISYILRAHKDQTMTVNVSSSDGTLLLNIFGLDNGNSLVKVSNESSNWTGNLPATQDYIIDVVPYIGTAAFTLNVTIK
jgi:hypothetical protein